MHGDMLVINVAPGCEYFLAGAHNGTGMRCTFCTYGAPDARVKVLGQIMGRTDLPDATYARMQRVLAAALEEGEVSTIYLVGGSLTDPLEEGRRFVEFARRVQRVNEHRVPVTCGSGAVPPEVLEMLYAERLVDSVCFNLEVWSERLFARICPGKQRYVGYGRWLDWLEAAVALWGRTHVYSAMVAGVELGPEIGMSVDEALATALEGADDLCSRGIIPIYSLYWPPAGRDLPPQLLDLRRFFEQLQSGYHSIRHDKGLRIWEGFLSRRASYMQLECDLDHYWAESGVHA
jgi:hypothetical protein